MQTYSVPPEISYANDANGTVVLDTRNGKFYGLTEVGAVIFRVSPTVEE